MKRSAFGDKPLTGIMLRVPKDLYKAVKLQAVMSDTTIAALIARYLEEGLGRDRGKR